ncbi:MAG TPA: hypothetical protein VHA06_02815, partial [Candidatus Angelobacter sp.]|nr:hypothetical protein [Candidatus Angelobacter sp.]
RTPSVFNRQSLALLAILAIFYSPLPAYLSHKPHPAIEVLLQTKGEVQFNRAVTARSKHFRARFYQRNSCSSAGLVVMPAPDLRQGSAFQFRRLPILAMLAIFPPKLPIYSIVLIR